MLGLHQNVRKTLSLKPNRRLKGHMLQVGLTVMRMIKSMNLMSLVLMSHGKNKIGQMKGRILVRLQGWVLVTGKDVEEDAGEDIGENVKILNGQLPEVGFEEYGAALVGSDVNDEDYGNSKLDPRLEAYQSRDKSKLEDSDGDLSFHSSNPHPQMSKVDEPTYFRCGPNEQIELCEELIFLLVQEFKNALRDFKMINGF